MPEQKRTRAEKSEALQSANQAHQELYFSLVEKEQETRLLRGQLAEQAHMTEAFRHRITGQDQRLHEIHIAREELREVLQQERLKLAHQQQLIQQLSEVKPPSPPTRRQRYASLIKRAVKVWREEGSLAAASKTVRKLVRKSRRVTVSLLVQALRMKSGTPTAVAVETPGTGNASSPVMELAPARSGEKAEAPTTKQHGFVHYDYGVLSPTSGECVQILGDILTQTPRARNSLDKPIDLIVPIYKGMKDTLRCLRSILTSKTTAVYEIIAINDASPDSFLTRALQEIANCGLITLLENPTNLGFVKTTNRGLALHPDRDVILLNSDTEVFEKWVDRLQRAAYSAKNIGSVTPLSNNATICSYPNFCEDNAIPEDTTAEQLDQFCAENNRGDYVDVPTAVGFCMYVRRDCLRVVGFLDENHFGKGYGEENDFCMRAKTHGWRHLLTTDTFVYHTGATSFGTDKAPAVERALQVLDRLHPDYGLLVEGHLRANPAPPFRRRLDIVRLRGSGPAMLYVTHSWGGGTERHVVDMAERLENEGVRTIVLRPLDSKHLRLERVTVKNTPNLVFELPDEYWTLREVLQDLGVKHAHIHHSIQVPQEVFDLIEDLEIPYDWTIHDYYPICPRINLIDESGSYCGEPSPVKCKICLEKNGWWGDRVSEKKPEIDKWRGRFETWLEGARKVIVPHEDAAVRLARYFPTVEFTERRHFEAHANARPIAAMRKAGEPLRVAVIGMIGPHKGSQILYDCAKDAARRQLPVSFHVVGTTDRNDAFRGMENVSILGCYQESEIFDLLESVRCHCAFFPAVWPETYSYTLSIAIMGKLFPVAFDLGAPASRIRECGLGDLVPLTTDAAVINDALLSLVTRFSEPLPERQEAVVEYKSLLRDYYGLPESWTEVPEGLTVPWAKAA